MVPVVSKIYVKVYCCYSLQTISWEDNPKFHYICEMVQEQNRTTHIIDHESELRPPSMLWRVIACLDAYCYEYSGDDGLLYQIKRIAHMFPSPSLAAYSYFNNSTGPHSALSCSHFFVFFFVA